MRNLLRRSQITPGGFLLLSVLVFFFDVRLLLVILWNVVIHEFGHLLMLRHCGVYIRRIILSGSGLCICCNTAYLSPFAMFLCAASGPAFGLTAAFLASAAGNEFSNDTLLLFSGTGLILSLFNLLPAKSLDGWRMLHAIAPRWSRAVGTFTAGLILLCGLVFMYFGYGTALAVMGIFLVLQESHLPDRLMGDRMLS